MRVYYIPVVHDHVTYLWPNCTEFDFILTFMINKRNIRLFQNLVRIINDSSHVPLYQFLTHFTCSVHAYGGFRLPRSLYIFIECTLNKLVTFYIPNYPKIHLFLMVSWISSKKRWTQEINIDFNLMYVMLYLMVLQYIRVEWLFHRAHSVLIGTWVPKIAAPRACQRLSLKIEKYDSAKKLNRSSKITLIATRV